MTTKISEIVNEVKTVIQGKDEVVSKVLMTILANGHVLLEDVPGVGKTTLVLSFSRVLGLDYQRIQFTPDVTPSDVVGFTMFDNVQNKFIFKQGPIMSNLLLADEINRTSSKTQSALLEVMEERQATVDGTTYPVPDPFVVIGTQNPIGSAGTQLLPQSQLDRFMLSLAVGYPNKENALAILRDRQTSQPLDQLRVIVTKEEISLLQDQVNHVFISDEILEYIVDLCEATREHELIELGVSPRGMLALSRLAKASAFMADRNYVLPEDVMAVFGDCCAHRIVIKSKARLANQDARQLLARIIRKIETPVIRSERNYDKKAR